MKFETVVDITTKVMLVGGAVGFASVIYLAHKFNKELTNSHQNLKDKTAESNRRFEETIKYATRTFKEGEALMSDLEDIIDGETPLGL